MVNGCPISKLDNLYAIPLSIFNVYFITDEPQNLSLKHIMADKETNRGPV